VHLLPWFDAFWSSKWFGFWIIFEYCIINKNWIQTASKSPWERLSFNSFRIILFSFFDNGPQKYVINSHAIQRTEIWSENMGFKSYMDRLMSFWFHHSYTN
jgi:hypothetical protein